MMHLDETVPKMESLKTNSEHLYLFLELLLPLRSREVARAGGAIPSTVRVPGEAALGTGFPVNITSV